MKYAMLTMLIPEAMDAQYRRICKHTMQDAANALQQNLYDGFCANLGRSIPVFNVLPVSSFPQYCWVPFIRSSPLGEGGRNLGFCNIKLIRNQSKSAAIYKALKKWCESSEDDKTLFVYTISQPFLAAVSKLKKRFPRLRVCAIVADLPNMSNLSSRQSVGARVFSRLRAKDAYAMLPCVDCFALLTKHMADYMGLTQPWCVMEGIAKEGTPPAPESAGGKIVLYSGTLHKKFGVMRLVEAFSKIDDPNARLVICGIGDSEEAIRRAAAEDGRISFLGQLKREDVLELQGKAAVLVNPRPGDEEFTKYSFPSKTMEYLASGVPVVAYKLPGIPEEYDVYLNYPENDSVEALAQRINQLCSLPAEERCAMGQRGRSFVLKNKNALTQTQRILELLKDEKIREYPSGTAGQLSNRP